MKFEGRVDRILEWVGDSAERETVGYVWGGRR